MVARLGVVEHVAVAVEGLLGHHGEVVDAVDVEPGAVLIGRQLHRDGALARRDAHPALLLEVGEDGERCLFGRQVAHGHRVVILLVVDEGLVVQEADALDMEQLGPDGEAREGGELLVADEVLEDLDLGAPVEVVTPRSVGEGLDTPQREGAVRVLRAPDDAYALAVDRLAVTFCGEHGQRFADRVVRAVKALDQHCLGGKEILVPVGAVFDL